MLGSTGQGARSDATLHVVPILSYLLCRCLQRGLPHGQTKHSTAFHSTSQSSLPESFEMLYSDPIRASVTIAKLLHCKHYQSVCLSVSLSDCRLLEDFMVMTLYYNISVSISCMLSQTCRQTDVCVYDGCSGIYKTLN